MGGIVSMFRHEETTVDRLDSLKMSIRLLERDIQHTQVRHKKVKACVIKGSIGLCLLYVLFIIIYYFAFVGKLKTEDWWKLVLYILPLLLLPFIVIMLLRFLRRHFKNSLSMKQEELNKMKSENSKILEDVKNTRTYREVVEILNEYDNPEAGLIQNIEIE